MNEIMEVNKGLAVLDTDEVIDGEVAWNVAQFIKDAEGDVRLAKGKFWNRCKHGTREEICDHFEWEYNSMLQLAIYAKDHEEFYRHSPINLPYTIWKMAKSAGISKGTKKHPKTDRQDFFKEALIDNNWTPKEVRKELEERSKKRTKQILEDVKKREEKKKDAGEPTEEELKKERIETGGGFRRTARPSTTMYTSEACEFFGLSTLSWITQDTLDMLYKGYSKLHHPDTKNGTTEDMAKLNKAKEVLQILVK